MWVETKFPVRNNEFQVASFIISNIEMICLPQVSFFLAFTDSDIQVFHWKFSADWLVYKMFESFPTPSFT